MHILASQQGKTVELLLINENRRNLSHRSVSLNIDFLKGSIFFIKLINLIPLVLVFGKQKILG